LDISQALLCGKGGTSAWLMEMESAERLADHEYHAKTPLIRCARSVGR
jgi:hypothetical protein